MDSRSEAEVGLLVDGSCWVHNGICEAIVRASARFSMKQSGPVETGQPRVVVASRRSSSPLPDLNRRHPHYKCGALAS